MSRKGPKDGKEELNIYKMKVKDLEGEVSRLKQRLNDLRKAKNSVMIKREREIIHVGHPQVNRNQQPQQPSHPPTTQSSPQQKTASPAASSSGGNSGNTVKTAQYKELEGKLANCEKEKEELSKRVKELLDQRLLLNRDLVDERRKCEGHKQELDGLMERLELKSTQQENKLVENSHRENYITDLMTENADLRKKNDQLIDDLSVKEAKWVEKEEIFKQKEQQFSQGWTNKYKKWMEDTESKIEELKKQNMMLRDCLNRGVPRDTSKKNQDAKSSK